MRLLDIGGSGVKTIKLKSVSDINALEKFEIDHYDNPDWGNFTEWANSKNLIDSDLIGISCAGFIENNGNIKLFRVGGWQDKKIVREFQLYSSTSRIFLLNDAEAHLMAHVDLYEKPAMSISLGTSVGFSISDKNGRIVRPPDNVNFDIGELSLQTRASNNKVWWALGANGLTELINTLGNDEGAKRFGNRLGAFLANLSSIFRPKTVVLSGGIAENCWSKFNSTVYEKFGYQKPDWLPNPNIVKSPFCRSAALVGMAKYIAANINGEVLDESCS